MNVNTPCFAYIHGLNSDKNSRSCKEIHTLLGSVHDFYYDYTQNAMLALAEIENKLSDVYKNNPNLKLIGSSLGGFFALYLAKKYQLSCTVFNPVTFPNEQLAPFKGKNHNFYTNREWNLTDEILQSYALLPLSTDMKPIPAIVLGLNDETVSPAVTINFWKHHAKILLTSEEHSIANYQKYLSLLKK
ncbi:MAG: hypothetical protein K2I05_02635 [Mailhella sp.]|nr:hypothetical protein [Mailhella sp.]